MDNKIKIRDYNNFLIIQTAFIGDIALALFFVSDIKKIHPKANITFITTPISADLVKCDSNINNVIIFDKRNLNKGIHGLKQTINEINANYNFDIIFSLHRSLRSTILAHNIKAKYKIGFNTSALSFLYNYKVKYIKSLNEINRNRQLLTTFNDILIDKNIINRPNILFTNNDIIKVNKLLYKTIDTNKKNIIIAIGSIWNTKRWNLNYFEILIKKIINIGFNIILIGSKSEQKECIKLANITGAFSIAGETSIPQTMYILQKASLLITNDSAPTHFASIMNIPTITIFGPTTPIFGFAPLAENSIVVEDKELFCRPCSIHGSNKCPRKKLECMTNITPDYIFNLVQNILLKIQC